MKTDIKNKVELIQTFINKSEQTSVLVKQLSENELVVSNLYDAIINDEYLMDLVHSGGIVTASGQLITYSNTNEELEISHCTMSYSVTGDLSASQLDAINPVKAETSKPVDGNWFARTKQTLEFGETTLKNVLDKVGESNCALTADQLAVLTEAEARGNGQ